MKCFQINVGIKKLNCLSFKVYYFPLGGISLPSSQWSWERRPCNHEVPSSSPGSGSQLWDFSLAHTFGASTGVVTRKENRERLV